MKKIILFVVVLFLLLVFSTPILPSGLIRLHSNVPISIDDVFNKVNKFYFIYTTKLPVRIIRKFFYIDVFYEENVIGSVQFTDGKFAITEKGHIIKKNTNKNKFNLLADMQSRQWDENFISMFNAMQRMEVLNMVKRIGVFDSLPGFYDKNKIVVIMGYSNYEEKLLGYKKVLDIYSKKMEEIKEIDMQYKDQAVVKWREQ